MIDINEIMKILPHRYPFLLIDRIVELEPGQSARGIKNVTANEPFFLGHFPDHPIMPGVLILEAMAQVGGVLAFRSADVSNKRVYFSRAHETLILNDIVMTIQIDVTKSQLKKLLYRMSFTGSDYVIDWVLVTDHLPHGTHIVACKSPVA